VIDRCRRRARAYDDAAREAARGRAHGSNKPKRQ
jgi:hypothetical protein